MLFLMVKLTVTGLVSPLRLTPDACTGNLVGASARRTNHDVERHTAHRTLESKVPCAPRNDPGGSPYAFLLEGSGIGGRVNCLSGAQREIPASGLSQRNS